ncbi:MAG: hypothetical protein N2589_02510 [bacterium]|nr:hypothetical protein [bacterium]
MVSPTVRFWVVPSQRVGTGCSEDTDADLGLAADRQIPEYDKMGRKGMIVIRVIFGKLHLMKMGMSLGRRLTEKHNHKVLGINVLFVDNSVVFIPVLEKGQDIYTNRW